MGKESRTQPDKLIRGLIPDSKQRCLPRSRLSALQIDSTRPMFHSFKSLLVKTLKICQQKHPKPSVVLPPTWQNLCNTPSRFDTPERPRSPALCGHPAAVVPYTVAISWSKAKWYNMIQPISPVWWTSRLGMATKWRSGLRPEPQAWWISVMTSRNLPLTVHFLLGSISWSESYPIFGRNYVSLTQQSEMIWGQFPVVSIVLSDVRSIQLSIIITQYIKISTRKFPTLCIHTYPVFKLSPIYHHHSHFLIPFCLDVRLRSATRGFRSSRSLRRDVTWKAWCVWWAPLCLLVLGFMLVFDMN